MLPRRRGMGWVGWENLGGYITSSPTVASWNPNRLDVFAKGNNNHIWTKYWNGSGRWSAWEDLGAPSVGFTGYPSVPAAVSWGPNRIDCFFGGADSRVYHISWNGSTWSGWTNIGLPTYSGLAVSSWGANRLDLFSTEEINEFTFQLLHAYSNNGQNWSNWEVAQRNGNGPSYQAPSAVSWGANRIDCFVTGGGGGDVYHMYWSGRWSVGWDDLFGDIVSNTAVASWAPERLDIFGIGRSDSQLHHTYWSGHRFVAWEVLGAPAVGIMPGTGPAAVSWAHNRIDCFVQGKDHALYHLYYFGP
ncbi:MAG: carbohydrate-binding protein [Candidatus Baltobacteraceae bacterium]